MTMDYSKAVNGGIINSALYTDQDVFQDELEHIFYNTWVFVAHESEVPESGDYVRRSIGLQPYLVVRGKDKNVRVLPNRCSHRGTLLCHEERGNVRGAITCWYHGWVFGLDGELLSVPYEQGSKGLDHKCLTPAKSESYGGFIFATLNPDAIPFKEYLGNGKALIDRVLAASPVNEVRCDAGWVRFNLSSNWKLQVENNVDGYHLNYVHAAFGRTIETRYTESVLVSEERLQTEVVDWKDGHAEINLGPGFATDLEWLGFKPGKKLPDYAEEYRSQILKAHPENVATAMIKNGPPHAFIFPNLFLAETNIVFYQMDTVDSCVQLHTPILLEGVSDELNNRIMRLCEAALGPTSFLLPDDAAISERQHLGFKGHSMDVDLRRGLNRERTDEEGIVRSHVTDETANRAFWAQYKKVMMA